MCGIVGLFIKDPKLEPELGAMLATMLEVMSDRGPDSAGFAVYGSGRHGTVKLTVHAPSGADFPVLAKDLESVAGSKIGVTVRSSHAVLEVPAEREAAVRAALRQNHPSVRVGGSGERMEIYKEVGLPGDVARRFDLARMTGTHGIGHTRMATESAVTTVGAHPFSTGRDQCLVHNGSLSNHNNLRRALRREGMTFGTENDTEVAAGYLTWRMREGDTLKQALDLVAGHARRLLHLRGRHRVRLRRAARSDRLQAGGDGGDRPLRRLRLGIPRAGQPAGHRQRPGLGAGAGHRLLLGARGMTTIADRTIDLAATSLRELNQALHRLDPDTNERFWRVAQPDGRHAIAVGVDAPITIEIDGMSATTAPA